MKFLTTLLFFSGVIVLIDSQIIELLKSTNESCCKSMFPNSVKTCQDAIEARLKDSLVELLYKKELAELKNTTVEGLQHTYKTNFESTCERVQIIYNKRKEKRITLNESQVGFLIAVTATYSNHFEAKAFSKYISKTPERMEAATKLMTYYYHCLHYYDDKYATRLRTNQNFADTIFSEKFQNFFLQFKDKNVASGLECGFIRRCSLDQAIRIYEDDVENHSLQEEENVYDHIEEYCERESRQVKISSPKKSSSNP